MSDLGFRFEVRKDGEIVVTHDGRLAARMRGWRAAAFLAAALGADETQLQQRMARLTGNYRCGNERTARRHRHNA